MMITHTILSLTVCTSELEMKIHCIYMYKAEVNIAFCDAKSSDYNTRYHIA